MRSLFITPGKLCISNSQALEENISGRDNIIIIMVMKVMANFFWYVLTIASGTVLRALRNEYLL